MKQVLAISAIAAIAFGASQALAATQHQSTVTKKLIVAMHDPGCHWFLVHGKYLKSTTVTGAVRLVNRDEAALKVASRNGVKRIPFGKSLIVRHGHYVVTMVHQASDDNYLKLTVR